MLDVFWKYWHETKSKYIYLKQRLVNKLMAIMNFVESEIINFSYSNITNEYKCKLK